jgi:hypothetical protein
MGVWSAVVAGELQLARSEPVLARLAAAGRGCLLCYFEKIVMMYLSVAQYVWILCGVGCFSYCRKNAMFLHLG